MAMSNTMACNNTPEGCSFIGNTLMLDGVVVPFIYYKALDEIWMPGKSVMRATGETNITHCMARVHKDDKMPFRELVSKKGLPLEGCYGFVTTPDPNDYHEKKAIWNNESGFYVVASQ